MDFNKMTLYEFCLWLSGYYDDILDVLKGIDFENTLQIEMYDFIKIKTDNFERQKFEYFIKDLRDFAWKFPFEVLIKEANESETGYPDYCTIRLTSNNNDYDIDFAEEETLRDRIEKMKLIVGDEMYPTEKILLFSDIAEEEYKKICGKIEKEEVKVNFVNPYPELFNDYCYKLFIYLNENYDLDNITLPTKYTNIYHFLMYEELLVCTQKEYVNFIRINYSNLSRIIPKTNKYTDRIQPYLRKLFKKFQTENSIE